MCARRQDQLIGGDGGALQPPGQLVGEQDVGELGLVVGLRAGVGPFALQVVEVDLPHGLRVGRDRDDAGRSALHQAVAEQVGEQERREMVEGEGVLESVGGDVSSVQYPPTFSSDRTRGSRAATQRRVDRAHRALPASSEMSGASVLSTPLGWSVGCSRNSLTSRFPVLPWDLPQVKEGTSHSRSEPPSVTGTTSLLALDGALINDRSR